MKYLCCSFFIFVLCQSCFCADLIEVYRQALENDPIFKQAYSNYMASNEALPQARASLLPQVTFSGSSGYANNLSTTQHIDYASNYYNNQWQVNATQALFNYKAWNQVQQAKATVKQAQAAFNDAAQQLILRTASNYFQALLAHDTLSFAIAKKRANKKQLDQANERFKVGVDTITSFYEAKAGFDQSTAEVIAAKNNLINQQENIRKITNHVYDDLAQLKNNQIPLIKPEPADANVWISKGLLQNYKLLSSKYALLAAKENIKALSSGNWPTLSLQASTAQTYNRTSDASVFVPSRIVNSNASVAINFPGLQGGLVASQVRQAKYNFQAMAEGYESAYRDVEVNTKIAFNSIIDGISKVKADRQTVASRINSLESTQAQYEAGTRTMVDVVNAQQNLFKSQEELAADQYNLIKSLLNLKYLAGTLTVQDLEEINSWLNVKLIDNVVS